MVLGAVDWARVATVVEASASASGTRMENSPYNSLPMALGSARGLVLGSALAFAPQATAAVVVVVPMCPPIMAVYQCDGIARAKPSRCSPLNFSPGPRPLPSLMPRASPPPRRPPTITNTSIACECRRRRRHHEQRSRYRKGKRPCCGRTNRSRRIKTGKFTRSTQSSSFQGGRIQWYRNLRRQGPKMARSIVRLWKRSTASSLKRDHLERGRGF